MHLVQLCARPPHTRGLKEQAGNASSSHVLQTLKLHVLISPSESHFYCDLINHRFEEDPFRRSGVLDMVGLLSLGRQ